MFVAMPWLVPRRWLLFLRDGLFVSLFCAAACTRGYSVELLQAPAYWKSAFGRRCWGRAGFCLRDGLTFSAAEENADAFLSSERGLDPCAEHGA